MKLHEQKLLLSSTGIPPAVPHYGLPMLPLQATATTSTTEASTSTALTSAMEAPTTTTTTTTEQKQAMPVVHSPEHH